MKWLRTLERKWIPNFRFNPVYKVIRLILVGIVQLPIIGISKLLQFLLANVRFRRRNKPDVVFADIINGWTNLMIKDPVIEEVAIKRARICAECPFAEYINPKKVQALIVQNRMTYIKDMKCGKCGCPLNAKVRSKGTYCPVGKW